MRQRTSGQRPRKFCYGRLKDERLRLFLREYSDVRLTIALFDVTLQESDYYLWFD